MRFGSELIPARSFPRSRGAGPRAAALIALALLAACASNPRVGKIPKGGPATMRPYQIRGVWYYPKDDPRYDERGIASWYGPGFHSKPTATGERFDTDGLTAAHKTLPLPSFVEVTNLDNGRRQLVRLNDRGPFVAGRIIDLSRRSAQLLGVDRTGVARVRVRRVYPSERQIAAITSRDAAKTLVAPAPGRTVTTVETVQVTPIVPAPRPPAVPVPAPAPALPAPPVQIVVPPPPSVTTIPLSELDAILPPAPEPSQPAVAADSVVQIAAVSDEARALALAAELAPYGPAFVDRGIPGLFRVRLGPFSAADAASALARVQAAGYGDARVVAAAR